MDNLLANELLGCGCPRIRPQSLNPRKFFAGSTISVDPKLPVCTIVSFLSRRELGSVNRTYKRDALLEARQIEKAKGKKKKKKNDCGLGYGYRNYDSGLTQFEKQKMKNCFKLKYSGYKSIMSGSDPVLVRDNCEVCDLNDLPSQPGVYYFVSYQVKKSKALRSRPDVFCIDPRTGLKTNVVRIKKRRKYDKRYYFQIVYIHC